MDGTGDEIFSGSAFTSDQDRQVIPLHPLDLFGNALHDRAGVDKSWKQGFEWAFQRIDDSSPGRATRTRTAERLMDTDTPRRGYCQWFLTSTGSLAFLHPFTERSSGSCSVGA